MKSYIRSLPHTLSLSLPTMGSLFSKEEAVSEKSQEAMMDNLEARGKAEEILNDVSEKLKTQTDHLKSNKMLEEILTHWKYIFLICVVRQRCSVERDRVAEIQFQKDLKTALDNYRFFRNEIEDFISDFGPNYSITTPNVDDSGVPAQGGDGYNSSDDSDDQEEKMESVHGESSQRILTIVNDEGVSIFEFKLSIMDNLHQDLHPDEDPGEVHLDNLKYFATIRPAVETLRKTLMKTEAEIKTLRKTLMKTEAEIKKCQEYERDFDQKLAATATDPFGNPVGAPTRAPVRTTTGVSVETDPRAQIFNNFLGGGRKQNDSSRRRSSLDSVTKNRDVDHVFKKPARKNQARPNLIVQCDEHGKTLVNGVVLTEDGNTLDDDIVQVILRFVNEMRRKKIQSGDISFDPHANEDSIRNMKGRIVKSFGSIFTFKKTNCDHVLEATLVSI